MSSSGINFEKLTEESGAVVEKLNRIPAHATVSTSGTLTIGELTPVNAESGEITQTLPTPKELGNLIAIEKTDSSANAVKISGTIRGESTSTTLKLKREIILYEAESKTSWRPISDHKTLGSLDERYNSGLAINVTSSPYNASPSKSASENNTAILAAIEAAAGGPVYIPVGNYPVSLSFTDQEINITGPGVLIQQEGSPAIKVVRTLGEPRTVTEVSNLQFGANLAEAVQSLTILKLAQTAVADVVQGDLFFLTSEDAYTAHYGASESAFTYPAAWFPVLGLGVLTTSGEELHENDAIVGHTSGATATLLSVSPHVGGGQILVFGSFTGTFESGEKLYVGGVEKGTLSGTPFLVMDGKLLDTMTTGPQIRKAGRAKCILDVTVEASANVDNPLVLVANRVPALQLEGVIDGEVKAFAKSAWAQLAQMRGCYGCDLNLRVRKLPNNATAAVGAYGYGCSLWGACEANRVKVIARNCRHAFTTNITENSTFAFAVASGIYKIGVPKYNTVYDSIAYNSISAGFDTHPGAYYTTFDNCRSVQTGSGNRGLSLSPGFQNRSFGTTYKGCEALGSPVGFLDLAQEWASPIKTTVRYLNCVAINYTAQGFVQQGIAVDTNTKHLCDNCEAVGGSAISTTEAYQVGFTAVAGNVEWRNCRSKRFNGAPYLVKGSTTERAVSIDCLADYTESSTSATGYRFDSSPATCVLLGYVVNLDPANAEALNSAIRMNSATALTLYMDGVKFIGTSGVRPLVEVTGAGAFIQGPVAPIGGFPAGRTSISGNTTYTMVPGDAQIDVGTRTAQKVIKLLPAGHLGRNNTIKIQDTAGEAATFSILIEPNNPATEKINGAESYELFSAYSDVTLHTDTANFFAKPQGAPIGATIVTATNASWPIPKGSKFLEITAVGGGGGGGGGGSAALAVTAQAGGSGGTAGVASTQVVQVGANTTLAVTVGAGGAGGSGGVGGGGAGGNGSNGELSKVVGTGINVTGSSGGKGLGSALSSTTVVKPVGYGGTGNGEIQGNLASDGGGSGSAGGGAMGYSGSGGGGGGAVSSEKGGGGGSGGSATGASAGTAGASTNSNGGKGGNGVANTGGGGGGGGGGSGTTGTGGEGGAGGSGFAIIRVVG